MRMSKYNYWVMLIMKAKASRIKRLLGQVFCQKNANAAKNALQKDEGNRIRRNVAPVLPTVSDVAVFDTTQSQDQSGEMSNDDDSYSKGAKYDDRHDTPRRSTRKRTPSIWMDDSEKRLKLAKPQSKPYDICSRCKRLHSKCDGSRQYVRCTKAGARLFNMLSLPRHYY